MKLNKLLLPMIGVASLAGVMMPLASCSCSNPGQDDPDPPGPAPEPVEQIELNLLKYISWTESWALTVSEKFSVSTSQDYSVEIDLANYDWGQEGRMSKPDTKGTIQITDDSPSGFLPFDENSFELKIDTITLTYDRWGEDNCYYIDSGFDLIYTCSSITENSCISFKFQVTEDRTNCNVFFWPYELLN